MPEIKRVTTASHKSEKATTAGKVAPKGMATKRASKAAEVVVPAKRASKAAEVVVAAKRTSKGAESVVPAKRASKAAEVVVAAKRASKGTSSGAKLVRGAGKGVLPIVQVKFGHVSVSVQRPTEASIKRAVTASKKVAKGLGERLVKPGVTLRHPPGVPVFTADPLDPQRVVRRLHGKVERGHFVKGQFKPEKSPA